jgi:hypothetical protein
MQLGGRLLCGIKAGTRRLFKRFYAKQRRREEKRDPENAPTKRANYRGWYD